MSAGLKVERGSTVLLRDIPSIGRNEFLGEDLYALEFDGGGFGVGPRISWWTVIYRPSSAELFKIGCWDGEQGGYFPELKSGPLPEGVTVLAEPKKFHELTHEEAKALVRIIVNSSYSEEQIRRRLTEAGFSGDTAAVTSASHGDSFMAMVMTHGPMGEVISV